MNAVNKQYKMKGMLITDYELEVPLDWTLPTTSPSITLFAREVVSLTRAADELPLLLFLQGGPGGKSPRPMPDSVPWMVEALKTHRVILIDQRGTEASAHDVYQLTYQRVIEKNQNYYARYPDDAKIMAKIAECLTNEKVLLPDGDVLTLERFQSIGILLGMGPGIDQVHWLMDEAFAGSDKAQLSDVFLEQVMNITSYHEGPLFAVIHESIYGQPNQSTSWSAQQVRAQYSEFDADHSPLMLTGEKCPLSQPFITTTCMCHRSFLWRQPSTWAIHKCG